VKNLARLEKGKMVEELKTFDFSETSERFQTSHLEDAGFALGKPYNRLTPNCSRRAPSPVGCRCGRCDHHPVSARLSDPPEHRERQTIMGSLKPRF
jgi:hypothetical protein